MTATASRDYALDQYGSLRFEVTLDSDHLTTEQLLCAVDCVVHQVSMQVPEHTAAIASIYPKDDGESTYSFVFEDTDNQGVAKIKATIALNFKVPRYVCYGLTSIYADLALPHITEHFDDPNGEAAREAMQEEANSPALQLLGLLHKKPVTEILAERVKPCHMLTEIASSLEVEPFPDIRLLLARASKNEDGGVNIDLQPAGKTGMYM